MTVVGAAGQAARPDRCLTLVGRAGQQVKDGVTNSQLQLRVAVDAHIGVLPARRPRTAMLAQETVEPERSRSLDALQRDALVGHAVRDALVRRDAVEYPA